MKKLYKSLNDNEFQNARLIIYIILLVEFLYLAYFNNFKCIGCPLCGMTRAVKSLLILNFERALEYNQAVWIFFIIIPLIVLDVINILYKKIIIKKNI